MSLVRDRVRAFLDYVTDVSFVRLVEHAQASVLLHELVEQLLNFAD